MNREEKERQERLQRMLARDQGNAPPDARLTDEARPAADVPPAGFMPPPKPAASAGGRRPAGEEPAGGAAEGNALKVDFTPGQAPRGRSDRKNGRPLSPILRRRRQRRRNALIALALAAALALAWITGALGAAMTAVSDFADSVALSFEEGGWPATTGIQDPIQVEELAGGFVELGSTDVAVFGANGALLRTIQPGYARPAITAGNTRFVLYNRATPELRIESRTRTLYTRSFDANILLCSMSPNGSIAVVTESSRYAAYVQVFDPTLNSMYEWYTTQSDGTPVALSFAGDNRRFAAGCISAADGQICTRVFLMDTRSDEPTAIYEAAPGEMILRLAWLGSDRVLAVLSDSAVLLDAATGAEVARYDYGGASLIDMDATGGGAALLLAGRGDATLTVLGGDLSPLASADAGAAAQLCCTDTEIYLAGGSLVRCFGYDGAMKWEKTLDAPAVALLDAAQPLVFTGVSADVLTAP